MITMRSRDGRTFGTDGDKTNSFAFDELQRFVDVGEFVDAHLASVGLRQLLPRNDFEQKHQLQPIAKVFFYVLDLGSRLAKVRVAPGGEGLSEINNIQLTTSKFRYTRILSSTNNIM